MGRSFPVADDGGSQPYSPSVPSLFLSLAAAALGDAAAGSSSCRSHLACVDLAALVAAKSECVGSDLSAPHAGAVASALVAPAKSLQTPDYFEPASSGEAAAAAEFQVDEALIWTKSRQQKIRLLQRLAPSYYSVR